MAGFRQDDEYFVPRASIRLPNSIHYYIERLLPDLTEWKRQSWMPQVGDKSECCRNFLYDLLPFLVKVIVQDGIYFIMDHPHHELSLYLKVSTSVLFICRRQLLLSNFC